MHYHLEVADHDRRRSCLCDLTYLWTRTSTPRRKSLPFFVYYVFLGVIFTFLFSLIHPSRLLDSSSSVTLCYYTHPYRAPESLLVGFTSSFDTVDEALHGSHPRREDRPYKISSCISRFGIKPGRCISPMHNFPVRGLGIISKLVEKLTRG